MDGVDLYVAEENIWRFLDRLAQEDQPERRVTLAHLLQWEEDKFAKTAERHETVQRWIEKCDRLIAHNNNLLNNPCANRALLEGANRTMEDIKKTLASLQMTWSREMNRVAKFAADN